MVKSRCKILIYGSTGAQNVGARFNHLMVGATVAPKVGSTLHKMSKNVQSESEK